MNLKLTLKIHKTAWLIFATVLFGLEWLMPIPAPSKPLIYFWQLWSMLLFDEWGHGSGFLVALLLGIIVLFLATAIFIGWVLQFVWGLLLNRLGTR